MEEVVLLQGDEPEELLLFALRYLEWIDQYNRLHGLCPFLVCNMLTHFSLHINQSARLKLTTLTAATQASNTSSRTA